MDGNPLSPSSYPPAPTGEAAWTIGFRDGDVLIRHVGDGSDDGQHAVEPRHADLAFDHGNAVLPGLPRVAERGDGASEQDQRPGDIAPRRLEALPVAVPCPAEQYGPEYTVGSFSAKFSNEP